MVDLGVAHGVPGIIGMLAIELLCSAAHLLGARGAPDASFCHGAAGFVC